MATATKTATVENRVKALAHETRVEALLEVFKAEEEAEAKAKQELEAKARKEGKSDAEIQAMLDGFKLNGEFPGLSPKELSVLCADGLERRRKASKRKKVAKKGDSNLSSMSYHVRELFEKFDLFELIDRIQRRGALEHRYRAKPEHRESIKGLIKFILG